MKKMIKTCAGFLLASTVSLSVYANNDACPSAQVIQQGTEFSVAIECAGKYYVIATKPLLYNEHIYWMGVGRSIEADSEKTAIKKAKVLLASATGPMNAKPEPYSFPDDGFTYPACRYKTSDSNIVITASPDS